MFRSVWDRIHSDKDPLCFQIKFQGGKCLRRGATACIKKIQTECEPRRKQTNRDLYYVGFLSSSAEQPHLVPVAVLTRSLTSTRFPMSGGGIVPECNSAQSFCFFNKVTS